MSHTVAWCLSRTTAGSGSPELLKARAIAIGLVLAGLIVMGGCKGKSSNTHQQPKPSPAAGAILQVQEMPGSAFVMDLSTQPMQPKFGSKTTFRVRITDHAGTLISGANVAASLVMPLMDMGKNQFPMKEIGGGKYEGTGEFNMAGEWEVNITATRDDKSATYRFNVAVVE